MMLVFTLMFTVLRAKPAADVPFPLFAYSGLIPWTMFSSGEQREHRAHLSAGAPDEGELPARDPSAHLRGRRAGRHVHRILVLAA